MPWTPDAIANWFRSLAGDGYHFVWSESDVLVLGRRPSLVIRDRERGFEVFEFDPTGSWRSRQSRALEAVARDAVRLYVRLVEAFEGRRPVVWS